MLPRCPVHEHGIKVILEAILEMLKLGSNLKGLSKAKVEMMSYTVSQRLCLYWTVVLKAVLALWFYRIHPLS